jgi:hypothetical protein
MEQVQNKEDVGYVIDTLAVADKRIHKIPVSFDSQNKPVSFKHYSLSANEETEMPINHAMYFLVDSAFIVKDGNKVVLKALANQEQATHIAIPEGFVLAEYSELNRDALVTRCKVLPGSAHIHPVKTKVDELIAFLKSAQPVVADTKKFDEVGITALDKMFGDA